MAELIWISKQYVGVGLIAPISMASCLCREMHPNSLRDFTQAQVDRKGARINPNYPLPRSHSTELLSPLSLYYHWFVLPPWGNFSGMGTRFGCCSWGIFLI